MFKKQLLQIALAAAALATAHGQSGDVPDLANARVTIPYSELKDLWKAAQQNSQPPAKPPVAAALLSAHYDAELRGDQLIGMIECEAQSFSDEWTLLPLAGSELQVDKIEPPTANVVLRDGAYALLTNRSGRQQVKLHFTARLVQEAEDGRLEIPGSMALVNIVTVRGIPPEKSLQIANAIQLTNEKGVASFRVAPQERIGLRIAAAANVAPVASQWQAASQCLARFGDEVLRYEAHVTATASGGSALSLRLNIPSGARVVSVESEDLAAWRADEVGGESRRVALQWRTPNLLQRQIDLVYELPQTLEGEWKLQAPIVDDGTTLPPLFAVAADAALGFTTADKSESVGQPPRWLAEKIAGVANALVTRSDVITARLLPVVEVAPAIVESATFNTRIVGDGSLINEQSYNIRTRAALVWSVQLPGKSELLSCAVDDRRVNPIDRGDGTLEVPIAPAADGKPTRITLVYTSRTTPFQPVSGRLKVELPKTPLLINALEWDLAIPAEYEIAALEGNVGPIPGATAREGSTVVRLKKELCRNERPSVELFYQRPEVKQ